MRRLPAWHACWIRPMTSRWVGLLQPSRISVSGCVALRLPLPGPLSLGLSLVGIEADQEQIGPGEVVSVAQQRLPRDRSDRVGAAVTEVQDSRVPALAEPGIGVERSAGVSLVEGHRLDGVLLQEPCECRLPPR